jgi:hypothetical protein
VERMLRQHGSEGWRIPTFVGQCLRIQVTKYVYTVSQEIKAFGRQFFIVNNSYTELIIIDYLTAMETKPQREEPGL